MRSKQVLFPYSDRPNKWTIFGYELGKQNIHIIIWGNGTCDVDLSGKPHLEDVIFASLY